MCNKTNEELYIFLQAETAKLMQEVSRNGQGRRDEIKSLIDQVIASAV